ncbi:MAG: hypothetical protein IKL52_06655 [Candidatus Gastranaerophilales bacterium]|nr:hypothetical protein [Candidatus Gastranaerophilales bacterium]
MNIPKITSKVIDSASALTEVARKASSPILQENAPQKLTNTLECLAASAVPAINKAPKKVNLPDFIYHITSKENYEKILKDGKMKISEWEANSANGCNGIYFVDKDNFLNKWLGRKAPELLGDCDIGEMLMMWTCKGTDGSVVIKIPTSKLDLTKLRFRPYLEACKETAETLDFETLEIGSKMVKEGLPVEELAKYIDTDEPIEYVYFGEITPDVFSGYTETSFSQNMREMIANLFN